MKCINALYYFSQIQQQLENSKSEKRRRLAAEVISDPKSYAIRKIENAKKKKELKKKKISKLQLLKGKKKKNNSKSAILYEEEF